MHPHGITPNNSISSLAKQAIMISNPTKNIFIREDSLFSSTFSINGDLSSSLKGFGFAYVFYPTHKTNAVPSPLTTLDLDRIVHTAPYGMFSLVIGFFLNMSGSPVISSSLQSISP